MGVQLAIMFQPDAERREEHPKTGTRWTTDYLGSLDELARTHGLPPLGAAVWDYDPEWDEAEEEPDDYRPPTLYDAAEGLRTVSWLLECLRSNSEAWRQAVRAGKSVATSADDADLEQLLEELGEFQRCFELGAKRGAQFYLQIV